MADNRSGKPRAALRVVEFPGSKELIYWLEARIDEALRGELIGIAAISMYRHNHWAISIKGEARRAPIMTRGLLPEVDCQLQRIVHGEE